MSSTQHTFAIGDVHGRADLLESLLNHIADEAAATCYTYRILFLGDIIDYGPDSRTALDLVASTIQTISGSQLILGNHEEMLLDFMNDWDDPVVSSKWLNNGGPTTINSYGFLMFQGLGGIHLDFEIDFPHFEMLLAASNFIETDTHIFVHAGLGPGVPLAEQTLRDLRWIRDDFLLSDYSFGKKVVHGHTWTDSAVPEVYPNRVAIDTDPVSTGRLTAMHIDPSGKESFLCTDFDFGEIVVRRQVGMHFDVVPASLKVPDIRPGYRFVNPKSPYVTKKMPSVVDAKNSPGLIVRGY